MCNGSADWSALAAQRGLDPTTVWGFVVFTYDASTQAYSPSDSMELSEPACRYLDRLWRAPPDERGKTCTVGVQVTVRTKTVTLTSTRRVRRVCPDYLQRLIALQTLSHESQHLAGIQDEATAECNGLQHLAWFAEQLGSTADQARQMAFDYYHDYYEVRRPGTPYYLPACPDPTA